MRKLLVLLLLCGCATSIEWSCPERVKVKYEDTRTSIKCLSAGRSVTITHPADGP